MSVLLSEISHFASQTTGEYISKSLEFQNFPEQHVPGPRWGARPFRLQLNKIQLILWTVVHWWIIKPSRTLQVKRLFKVHFLLRSAAVKNKFSAANELWSSGFTFYWTLQWQCYSPFSPHFQHSKSKGSVFISFFTVVLKIVILDLQINNKR